MPNYYRDKYNDFIDHAKEIYTYLSDEYLDEYDNRLLELGSRNLELGKMQFVRIQKYRHTNSKCSDFKTIRGAMQTNLRFCAGIGAALGYFIVSNNSEKSIYLGVEEYSTDGIVSNLVSMIPDCSLQSGFISANTIKKVSCYGGIVSGNCSCNENVIDSIIASLNGINSIIGVIAVPMPQREINAYEAGLVGLKQMTEDLLHDDSDTYRRVNRRCYSYVSEVDGYLDKSIRYYGKAEENYWKYSIWFGCEKQENLSCVGNALKSALNAKNEDGRVLNRCFYTTENPFQKGELSLSLDNFSSLNYELPESLVKQSFISYISTEDLASILQFPTYSVNGFEVVDLNKDNNSVRLFDTEYDFEGKKVIALGIQEDSGIPYSISLDDLSEHVLITGATGAGKTNTVMRLAMGVYSANIPILIIEPSKKDYWHLFSAIKDLKIFSFGKDAELPGINPLIPEEGTIIANHVDSLMHAFSGAFEMEPPTRFALDGLLKYAYEKFGWNLDEVAYQGEKKYPKLHDLTLIVHEYVNEKLPYGDEVRNNIYGSLINRLTSLDSGLIGAAANRDKQISGKELCAGNVLIELDDLSLETKPFMTMLMIIKVEQYLRQCNAAHSVKNVIVLEEAHNIFSNVNGKETSDTKRMASNYFSNMLSQIREYGTGIIIADQGASQINDTAVSNTKIKIIHGIVDENDIDKIAFSLNLSDAQRRVFPTMQTGEAIVAVRGSCEVSKVKVDKADYGAINNLACSICTKKKHCSSFNDDNYVAVTRKSIYAYEIYDNRFNANNIKNIVDNLASKLGFEGKGQCLLGMLLDDESLLCGDREKRRIIQSYMK